MRLFVFKVFRFALVGIIIGEIVVRAFHLNADVPRMFQKKNERIRFYPNQNGYWLKGTHKWSINKYGNFGYEPKSLESIYTVIGDSYISNNMNPPECHQANYLSKLLPTLDFFPTSRDGASFLEFMEMKDELDSLNPIGHLLFVHHGDFVESISNLGLNVNTTQVNLNNKKLQHPVLRQSRLKDALYNFKFPYYIYRNYLVKSVNAINNRDHSAMSSLNYAELDRFIVYIKSNYEIDNVYLVLSPDFDSEVRKILKLRGFKILQLHANRYKEWQLERDSHWSCLGHQEAAKQVAEYLLSVH